MAGQFAGFPLDALMGGVGNQFQHILNAGFAPPQPIQSQPFGSPGQVGGAAFAPPGELSGQPFAPPGQVSGNPFGSPGGVGGQPFAPPQPLGGDPFGIVSQVAQVRANQAAEAEAKQREAIGKVPAPNTPQGNTGAAGASNWLKDYRGNSPLVPVADDLAAYAVSKGVDPGAVFGLLQKESQFGADNGMGTRQNNPGNIMADGADPANGVIILRSYGSMLEGAKAMVDLLASYGKTYGANTLEHQVAVYYVGPEAYKRYGLNANDAGGQGPGGNGTVKEYLEKHVYPVMQSYNSRQGAAASGSVGTVNKRGEAFPVDGFAGKVNTHWDSGERGATDIFAPIGTPVRAMTGGVVTGAGYSDIGGYYVMIKSDDGTEEYYAHMYQQPLVAVGQRVQGGMQLGGVGDTGNAKGTGPHLHLGKGYGIISGSGPQGGAGRDFDLISWLENWGG
jgi:murein DD-endopeptidase MepM/ murein hydrolase activator NlpD